MLFTLIFWVVANVARTHNIDPTDARSNQQGEKCMYTQESKLLAYAVEVPAQGQNLGK